MNSIEMLQRWYLQQCDGAWEHQHGVAIDTLDNPGWSVTIDLEGTSLESMVMESFVQDNGESDWVICKIDEGKFMGNGDAQKLGVILDRFVELLPAEFSLPWS